MNARLGAAILVASAGCADDHGPRLESVTPASARAGDLVMLSGQRLCGDRGDCEAAGGEIQFGLELPTLRARIASYSDRAAEVEVPSMVVPGATTIVITVNEAASNGLAFEVLP
ncbi:MAG: hypothetical protein WKG01_19020 [Kofleriaceae bacterium]